MQEQHAELANREIRRFGTAPPADRQALPEVVAAELQEHLAGGFIDDLDRLEFQSACGRVAHAHLVDEVAAPVGADDRPGRRQDLGHQRRKLGVCGH